MNHQRQDNGFVIAGIKKGRNSCVNDAAIDATFPKAMNGNGKRKQKRQNAEYYRNGLIHKNILSFGGGGIWI